MYLYIRKIPIYICGLAILLLSSCGSGNKVSDLLPDGVPDLEAITNALDLKLGEEIELGIPLDVFCGLLGTPGKDCREQFFASKYNFFRMYPAIENSFPAVVLTRVNADGEEEILPGGENFLLAALSGEGQVLPTTAITKERATEVVNKYRSIFIGAPQVFTFNYHNLLSLFSTSGQEVPEGYKPIKNHLNLNVALEKSGGIQFSLRTYLGNALLSEVPLGDYLPVWIDVCPGQCGPDKNYFLPNSK